MPETKSQIPENELSDAPEGMVALKIDEQDLPRLLSHLHYNGTTIIQGQPHYGTMYAPGDEWRLAAIPDVTLEKVEEWRSRGILTGDWTQIVADRALVLQEGHKSQEAQALTEQLAAAHTSLASVSRCLEEETTARQRVEVAAATAAEAADALVEQLSQRTTERNQAMRDRDDLHVLTEEQDKEIVQLKSANATLQARLSTIIEGDGGTADEAAPEADKPAAPAPPAPDAKPTTKK